jgi:dienelactone hydrolase
MGDVRFSEDWGFDFGIRAALQGAMYRMADVGEVLATGAAVPAGDIDAWFDAWTGRGRRVRDVAEACERDGRYESASLSYLRAANYLFAAFWYVLGTSDPGRHAAAWREHRTAFEKAMRLWPAPVERLSVPFGPALLDGYLYSPAAAPPGPLPLTVIVNGIDTPVSDVLMIGGQDAVLRGFHAVIVDGPGQGHALQVSGLGARHDWEVVVGAVLDALAYRDDIDPQAVSLQGIAHGGYLAARAAAFEPRVRALVLDPGVMRVVDGTLSQLPQEIAAAFRAADRETFEAALAEALPGSAELAFTVAKAVEPFGGGALWDALSGLARMDLAEVAGRVTCPALVLDPEEAGGFPGGSQEVAAALGGPVTLQRFTAEDGGALDCEIPAALVRNQRVSDWLDATLDLRRPRPR